MFYSLIEIGKKSELTEYGKLYSTQKLKKQRLICFNDAFKEWEEGV